LPESGRKKGPKHQEKKQLKLVLCRLKIPGSLPAENPDQKLLLSGTKNSPPGAYFNI